MFGLAVALAAALVSPPEANPAAPGGPYAGAAEDAQRDAQRDAQQDGETEADAEAEPRRRAKRQPAPGPRLSPSEEEPRGIRVRGHRILPVPTFRAEPSVGLTFGVRGRYVYRPPGESFDVARLDVVGRVSTKLVQDHAIDVQLRDLLHRQEILDLNLRFVDDPVFPYVGVAEYSRYTLEEMSAPRHRVHLRSIGAAFDYQHPFAVFERGEWGIETTGYARWLVGARFAHDKIQAAPDTLWSEEGNPEQLVVRRGSIFGGVAWDSRDNGWSPQRGSLHDVSIELGGPWVGSTQNWARFNGSARFYRPIGTPKLVLANQFLADAILGDAPLVSQGEFGGLLLREGIGGRDTGRGYFRRRFIGPVKLFTSVELRVEPYEIRLGKRSFTPALKAFMDVGYVRGPGQDDARPIISGGPGFYFIWDRFFVFRVDAGFSPEGHAIYVTTDHAF